MGRRRPEQVTAAPARQGRGRRRSGKAGRPPATARRLPVTLPLEMWLHRHAHHQVSPRDSLRFCQ